MRTPFKRQLSILLAADSFKGAASSAEIEDYLEVGILRAFPDARIRKVPIADGGEGTLDAFIAQGGGRRETIYVENPFGKRIAARFGVLSDDSAVIEMAEAAGIGFSDRSCEAALRASTYGVGQLLHAVLEQGIRRVYIGLGGSATTDGGAGLAEALGIQLLDSHGKTVPRGLQGLREVVSVDKSLLDQRLQESEIIALSDVDTPLTGTCGAVYVFGPQKGLLDARLCEFDAWMQRYANVVFADTGYDASLVAGAGAAGGLGFGLLSFCGATITSGVEALLDRVHFNELLRETDLVITGEGRMDNQTAHGKAPVGIARRAALQGVPTYAVVGSCTEDLSEVHRAGIQRVFASAPSDLSLEECMRRTSEDVAAAAERAVRFFIQDQQSFK
ncbi:glycerate kinase [Lancefieldella sp. Marseille-Q7238]|uniref:glycerate kinase family protein n=1 Tax=Lancefieldella sp. Marseille-Q7238 TaxID=3022127 RepID=UPI0024A821B0|nr:glycerate kinase [Lancefieldella sp. Marseille-Q7238]